MANQERYLTTLDIPRLQRYTVGFDKLFNDMFTAIDNKNSGYPPCNIVKHSDTSYSVELAVAGFRNDELTIESSDQTLLITGQHVEARPESDELLHHGISNRSFRREFKLAEHVVVDSAVLEHGILRVQLLVILPEEKQPRRIAIEYKT